MYFFNLIFQFTVATRSGLVGLVVVSLVVQEWNTVPVPAQILGQHTEDEDVTALDHVENGGVVTLSDAQVQASCKKLMEVLICMTHRVFIFVFCTTSY